MNVLKALLSLALRVLLVMAGLVFAISLVLAAAVATLAWLLRLCWHRMTGRGARPVRARVEISEALVRATRGRASVKARRRADDVTDVDARY